MNKIFGYITNLLNNIYNYRFNKNVQYQSNASKVKQFTEESSGIECPLKPQFMSEKEVTFIIKMVLSEMTELAQTVSNTPDDALKLIASCVGTDFNKNYEKPNNNLELIAEQADAAVDAMYYLYNAFCKKGVNLDKMFDVVHQANMAKKFTDGTFHKRADGKIVKPDNWREPDITGEIHRQTIYGQW